MTAAALSLGVAASRGPYACALRRGDGELIAAEPARDLLPAVQGLLARAGHAARDLEEIRVDLGPGSYTALRVAVTFARTMRAFARAGVLVATSLELLALHAWVDLGVPRTRVVRAILDARRERFSHAELHWNDRVELRGGPVAAPLSELLAALRPDEALIADPTVLPRLPAECAALSTEAALPRMAELLFHPALAPRLATAEDLTPLYLMASYADGGA